MEIELIRCVATGITTDPKIIIKMNLKI